MYQWTKFGYKFFFFLVKQTYTQEREKRVKGVAATNNYNSH